mmetsp:Transcript_26157/g.25339  ORF Transcript_26157/g.25339 Transcript_26157/m.25339 type:complete len:87 (-) Transcript_26157:78-338(-)
MSSLNVSAQSELPPLVNITQKRKGSLMHSQLTSDQNQLKLAVSTYKNNLEYTNYLVQGHSYNKGLKEVPKEGRSSTFTHSDNDNDV